MCYCIYCFQFLCFALNKVETASFFFSSSDASDLSCFSESRQLYRSMHQSAHNVYKSSRYFDLLCCKVVVVCHMILFQNLLLYIVLIVEGLMED